MKALDDPRRIWWIWRDVQLRLTKWTHALLQGRAYKIFLKATGSAFNDPSNHIIQVNPQLFARLEPDRQFQLTQGLLAHEVGHALFTDAWPGHGEDLLREMTNMLEDERIERAIVIAYPGIRAVIRKLGDRLLADLRFAQCEDYAAEMKVYACCLIWRWASSRMTESGMLEKMHATEQAHTLWKTVRPLVESAWSAPYTRWVIDIARKVLETLGLDPDDPPTRCVPGLSFDIPMERRDATCCFPDKPSDVQPGLGVPNARGSASAQDQFSKPKPYLELENQAAPLACQLAESLKVPVENARSVPHAYMGRFNLRQDLRTPETPNLARLEKDRSSRSLALYILVDRSGSMCDLNPDVQLALMTMYLAAVSAAIPIGITFFGSGDHRGSTDRVFEVTPIASGLKEEVKALIAGYEGVTGAEFLHWAIHRGEDSLAARPESKKVLIVIHDGKPVYKEDDGDDWELSCARLRYIESRSITPIGVYLGNNLEDLVQLKALFPRFIHTTGKALPDRLGLLLRGLSR
jgi:hypothetical protein